ncbi:transketolase [Pseudomonadota bacterium]|nr:transketolase [Pseudomonadota bacterium]
MRKQFKDTVLSIAEQDERAVVILGDVSVYMFNDFATLYPDRFYNLGICENTIISVAGGMASCGLFPFVHTIAPFLTERCFEQIKLDMCYNEFGGNIVTCGASFDYAWDGSTHHCLTDLALMTMLPKTQCFQPGSNAEVDQILRDTYDNGQTTYIRLSDHPHDVKTNLEIGKGTIIRETDSSRFCVITAGPLLPNVMKALEGLDVSILYFHTIKPLDVELLQRFVSKTFVVIHDAFGLKEMVQRHMTVPVHFHGVSDQFLSCYGSMEQVRESIGLDVPGINDFVTKLIHP